VVREGRRDKGQLRDESEHTKETHIRERQQNRGVQKVWEGPSKRGSTERGSNDSSDNENQEK